MTRMDASPFENHGRLHDNWNRKAHKKKIGDHVTSTHGNKLRIPLTTTGSRVRDELPVAVKWLTLGQGGHDDGNKGEGEEPSDELQHHFVRSFPYLTGKTLQELGNGELCDP